MEIPENLTIEALGNRVGGIARPEGFPAVFVRNALPGEVVSARRTGGKKSFIEAEIVEIHKPSPHRREPFCKYWGVCGGCSLQHLDYTRELHWKRIWIEKALRNLEHPDVQQVTGSPSETGCRNRVTFDVIREELTLHAFRGDPVPVDSCPMGNSGCRALMKELMEIPPPSGTTRVSVRGALNTPDRTVEYFRRNRWERNSMVTEKLGDYLFPVPAGGFFQVNTAVAELMVKKVMELVPENSGRALDLYGGVGTFALPLASKGYRVDSVEMNRAASNGCSLAVKMNGLSMDSVNPVNCRDRTFLSRALSENSEYQLLITDPPRAGMGIRITRQIRRMAPETIVYVSCNPFSAARDIAILIQGGYKLSHIQPFDMFPRTDHVETVFLLEGKKR